MEAFYIGDYTKTWYQIRKDNFAPNETTSACDTFTISTANLNEREMTRESRKFIWYLLSTPIVQDGIKCNKEGRCISLDPNGVKAAKAKGRRILGSNSTDEDPTVSRDLEDRYYEDKALKEKPKGSGVSDTDIKESAKEGRKQFRKKAKELRNGGESLDTRDKSFNNLNSTKLLPDEAEKLEKEELK